MSLYAIIARDRSGALETRLAVRPAHLEHLKGLGDALVLAGPFLDAEGKPNGSLVVVKADSIERAEAIAQADPYARENVFETVSVQVWSWGINKPEGL